MNLKFLQKNFSFLIAVVVLASCKTAYKPNMQNVPLFREKGEFRGTINNNNLQGAYAVTDKIGVMVNGYYNPSKFTTSSGDIDSTGTTIDSEIKTSRFLVEGGVGYYKPISDAGVFEVYGGAGYGKIKFDEKYKSFAGDNNTFSANMIRFFVQPSIGLTKENIDFAFSTRIAAVKFGGVDTVNYSVSKLQFYNIYNIDQQMFFFIEPGVTLRVGPKWAKFHVQAMYSQLLSDVELSHKRIAFNMGLHINIANRYK